MKSTTCAETGLNADAEARRLELAIAGTCVDLLGGVETTDPIRLVSLDREVEFAGVGGMTGVF